jgi:hypothetical protein
MRAAFWISLAASFVLMLAGASAPAASVVQLVGVLGGVVLFGVGGVLMVLDAANQPPVWTGVEPWGERDE